PQTWRLSLCLVAKLYPVPGDSLVQLGRNPPRASFPGVSIPALRGSTDPRLEQPGCPIMPILSSPKGRDLTIPGER
ncbi:MAG: hypothetical protein ABIK79_11100, partial [Chloroflexota bacterium]